MPKHVDRATAGSRRVRPVELGAGPKVIAGAEGSLEHERSGRRRSKFRAPPFEKGRAERDVLRPRNRAIARTDVLDDFARANRPIDELELPLELELCDWKTRPHRQIRPGALERVRRDRGLLRCTD